MAKIEITKTELVWPGKYNEDGTRRETPRVSLPFQVIETVNESRATRSLRRTGGIQAGLFDTYSGKEGETLEEGWKNKLIWGENLLVMSSLLDKFAGKVDLIYIDPPFATGLDFSVTTEVGERAIELTKEQSLIEEKAYRDTWGSGVASYLEMMAPRLSLMHSLLSQTGFLVVHVDWRMAPSLRLVLDEIFGTENFRNELIWHYKFRMMRSEKIFNRKHDNLLLYAKAEAAALRIVTEEWTKEDILARRKQAIYEDDDGREWIWMPGGKGHSKNKRKYLDEIIEEGKALDDVWDMPIVTSSAHERTGYATQKPEALLERIIAACTSEDALVGDFFVGSGTTAASCERLARRWLACDLSRFAIHTTRKRLLGIERCKPFEILNLGKYERQYWQMATFGEKDTHATEQTLYEYLAFVLKLYGAQPLPGLQHLHGKKGKALVHVGAVDAPVTIDEVNAALAECLALKQAELHVLGWEWEMGLNALMVGEAKKQGVKLLLLQIPREVMEQQAVDKGDIRFFELAYLEAEIAPPKKLTLHVKLKDFVISDTDLIPAEVRSKIKKWSDYVDYWAVDWDFQNDTFMQGWVTYRTRKDRTLALRSDDHTYAKPGRYRILVKVIDIFGNDTSRAFDAEVK